MATKVVGEKQEESPGNNRTIPAEGVRQHLRSVDGLRAVACLAVVSHHCFVHGGRYEWPLIPWLGRTFNLSHLLSLGYVGVELFFVISGFCLSYSVIGKDRPFDWRDYAWRRALRIVPPYLVAFFLFALFVGPTPAKWRYWIYGTCFISVLFNASFWTLCVEARWYVILPFLLRVERCFGFFLLMLLAVLVSVGFKAVEQLAGSAWSRLGFIFTSLPFFLPTFVLGIGAARLFCRDGKTSTMQIGLLRGLFAVGVISLLIYTPMVPDVDFLSYKRIIPASIAGFAAVLLALFDPVVGGWLSGRLLSGLGAASYSIYLVHEPLIHGIYRISKQWDLSAPQQFAVFQVAVFPFCLAVGYLFFLVVEKPSMIWTKRLLGPPVRVKTATKAAAPSGPVNAG